jgi:hypothetical protein
LLLHRASPPPYVPPHHRPFLIIAPATEDLGEDRWGPLFILV